MHSNKNSVLYKLYLSYYFALVCPYLWYGQLGIDPDKVNLQKKFFVIEFSEEYS